MAHLLRQGQVTCSAQCCSPSTCVIFQAVLQLSGMHTPKSELFCKCGASTALNQCCCCLTFGSRFNPGHDLEAIHTKLLKTCFCHVLCTNTSGAHIVRGASARVGRFRVRERCRRLVGLGCAVGADLGVGCEGACFAAGGTWGEKQWGMATSIVPTCQKSVTGVQGTILPYVFSCGRCTCHTSHITIVHDDSTEDSCAQLLLSIDKRHLAARCSGGAN